MSSYRQIRPSWIDVRQREETVIEVTQAVSPYTQPPAPAQTVPAPAASPPTGTAAVYQQVIASLQNQVNTLLTMYMEGPNQGPAQWC